MKKPVFVGSATAIATPFTCGGDIDYRSYANMLDMQIDSGTAAIVALGTTGENPTLSDDEFSKFIAFTVQKVAGRIPVVAGTGRNCTAHSVELSRQAKSLGADAILAVTPYYNKTTQAGLIAHITAIADSTDLPVILYNVPSRTGLSFTADTYAALSALPTVNGVKEASGNFTLMLQTLKKCPPDFYLYCGNDDQITPMLALGAVGVISVLANIMPAQTAQLCKYALDGDYKMSAMLQIGLCDIIDALFVETNPIPLKHALAAMDLCDGSLRLPLVQIGENARKQLYAAMQAHGLINK